MLTGIKHICLAQYNNYCRYDIPKTQVNRFGRDTCDFFPEDIRFEPQLGFSCLVRGFSSVFSNFPGELENIFYKEVKVVL
jgi:hypothetical protein